MFGKGLEVGGIAGGVLRAGLLPDPRFRMTLTRLLCFAAAFGLADPMTGFADPVIFDGAQGTVALETVPDRIVALDVAAADTLAALGVTPVGVPAPLYVPYLDAVAGQAAPVGSFFEPDMEAIAALAPDLIVVGPRAAAMADVLGRIAPVADMSVGTDAYRDGLARLAAYGTMLGLEDRASEIAATLESRLAEVRTLVEAQGGTALILMTNGPKLSVFGPESRFGWLHTEVGFRPAVDGITDSRHGEAVSFEYVAQADPGTLLVIDRGAAIADGTQAASATLDTPLVQGTKAAQAGRVVYLSPAELYIATGGVTSLTRTLDEIAAALGAM
jgi:iron complex transport system substrate-binding protein